MSNRTVLGSTAAAFLLVSLVFPALSPAQSIVYQSDETRLVNNFSWLPYAFYSGSFGLGFGVGGVYTGRPAEESAALGAATVGTKGSYNVMFRYSNLRVPGTSRLYIAPLGMFGRYQDQFIYAGQNNPGFEGQRAGANDSDQENYLEVTQWDNRLEFDLTYLLPIGHAADDDAIINRYVIKEGLLDSGASGGVAWNPLTSGRTTLTVTPQWREQTYANDDLDVPLSTVNAQVGLEYNNFDFPFNPSRGSYQRVSFKQDFEDDELTGEWQLWEAEYAKVFDVGRTDRSIQRVLAFDFWTAYVPTWETAEVDGKEVVTKRPPPYDGAVLGGIDRMRAYEDNRFHDKAAIYYSAEWRWIPEWQPLRRSKLLEFADISYWQWVLFAEAGQVAPSWDVEELHSDLHFDGGISLRGMLHTAVCRIDFAAGLNIH